MFLRQLEGVVPEASLEVALELRQVVVRARTALEQHCGVVEAREAEVEEARRHGLAVDQHVALLQVPATRTHNERCRLLAEAVALLRRFERDRSPGGVDHVPLAVDDVLPGR